MDKYTQYSLALARLSKVAFMGEHTVETSDELILADMADNNKAIIESLRLVMSYFMNGFQRATKAFSEYETELFQSADVKSLLNRMKYMEAAIAKSVENAKTLTTADEFEELKKMLGLQDTPEEEQEEESEETAEEEETAAPEEEDTDEDFDIEDDPEKENLKKEMYEIAEAYPKSYTKILKGFVKQFFTDDLAETGKSAIENFSSLISNYDTSKVFTDLETFVGGNANLKKQILDKIEFNTSDSAIKKFISSHIPSRYLKNVQDSLSKKTNTKLPGGGSAPSSSTDTEVQAPDPAGEEQKILDNAKSVVIEKLNSLIDGRGTSGNILNTILSRFVSNPERVDYTPEEVENWAEALLKGVADDLKRDPENIVFTENTILDSMPVTDEHLSADPLPEYEKNKIPLISDSFRAKLYRKKQDHIEEDYSFTPTGENKISPIYALTGEKEFEKVSSLDSADTIIYEIENIYIALPKIKGIKSSCWGDIIRTLGGLKCFSRSQIFKLKVKKSGNTYKFTHPLLEDYPQPSSAGNSAATPDNKPENFGLTEKDFGAIKLIKESDVKGFTKSVDLKLICGGNKDRFSNRLNVLKYLVEHEKIKNIRNIPDTRQANDSEIKEMLTYIESQGADFSTAGLNLPEELIKSKRRFIIEFLIPKVHEDEKASIFTDFLAVEGSKFDPEIAQLLWNNGYKVTTESYDNLTAEEKKRVDERLNQLAIPSANSSTSTKAPLYDRDSIFREVSSNLPKAQDYYSKFSSFQTQAENMGLEDSFKAEIKKKVENSLLWLDYFVGKNDKVSKYPDRIDQNELEGIKNDLTNFNRVSTDYDKDIKDFENRINAGKSAPEPEKSEIKSWDTIKADYMGAGKINPDIKVYLPEAIQLDLRNKTATNVVFKREDSALHHHILFKTENSDVYLALPKRNYTYDDDGIMMTGLNYLYDLTGSYGTVTGISNPAKLKKVGEGFEVYKKGSLTLSGGGKSAPESENKKTPTSKDNKGTITIQDYPEEIEDNNIQLFYDTVTRGKMDYDPKKNPLTAYIRKAYTEERTNLINRNITVNDVHTREPLGIYLSNAIRASIDNFFKSSSETELEKLFKKQRNKIKGTEILSSIKDSQRYPTIRAVSSLLSQDLIKYLKANKIDERVAETLAKQYLKIYVQESDNDRIYKRVEKTINDKIDESYKFPPYLYYSTNFDDNLKTFIYEAVKGSSMPELKSAVDKIVAEESADILKKVEDHKKQNVDERDVADKNKEYANDKNNKYNVRIYSGMVGPDKKGILSSGIDVLFENAKESIPHFHLHKTKKENTYLLYPTKDLLKNEPTYLSACYDVEGTGDTIQSITKPAVVYGTRYGSKSKDDTYILQQKGKLTLSGNSSTQNSNTEKETPETKAAQQKLGEVIKDHLKGTSTPLTCAELSDAKQKELRSNPKSSFVLEDIGTTSGGEYCIYGTSEKDVFIALLKPNNYNESSVERMQLSRIYDFSGTGEIQSISSPAIVRKSGDNYTVVRKGKLTLG